MTQNRIENLKMIQQSICDFNLTKHTHTYLSMIFNSLIHSLF